MPLTVLKSPSASSPQQLVRLFHQSQLEWARHLGDETELDFGRWIPAAGCLLEAFLLPGMNPADVIDEVTGKSQQAGVEWTCCTLNPSMPIEQTAPLSDALLSLGWVSGPIDILYRSHQSIPYPTRNITGLKIIPARASYRHYKQLMGDHAAIHLDDSHFESLLALWDQTAVGCIGLLTSGEVGTLRDWFVTPPKRQHGVGQLVLERALESCVRGMLRHVMIGVPTSANIAQSICKTHGFSVIGQWTPIWKKSCISSGLFA